jgi:hypothetical protein
MTATGWENHATYEALCSHASDEPPKHIHVLSSVQAFKLVLPRYIQIENISRLNLGLALPWSVF